MPRKKKPTTLTEKGAPSHVSTGSALVDLFFKSVRGASNMQGMLTQAWQENALDTLKLIFQTRDCRGGKGERQLFYQSLKWMVENYAGLLERNMKFIPHFGTWRDLLVLMGTSLEGKVLTMFAEQLKADLENMQKNNRQAVSLCAKWAPTESSAKDKTHAGAARKLARLLFPKSKKAYEQYRKVYLTPLRKYLSVTETYMCAQQWTSIPYQAVASRCMFLGRSAFTKHDKEGFSAFLEKVMSGKATIKGKQMYPHEITRCYFTSKKVDLVLELQWKVIIDEVKKNGSLNDSLVLSDVSGSMSGTPLEVSIGLGLLISEVAAPPFKDHIITFHETPTFHVVQGETLKDRVQSVKRMPWGGTTNFQAAFDLILSKAKQFKLPAKDMPKRLFVISDMQFDVADRAWKTNHEHIKSKFRAAGYTLPQIVYWNVRADTPDFPVQKGELGVALVSGYSPSLLKLFMEKQDSTTNPSLRSEVSLTSTPKAKAEEKIDPFIIMKKAIDDERYACLTLQ